MKQRYDVGTDGYSWYVRRDKARIMGMGAFGHREDAEHIAARRNEGKRTFGTLPSTLKR